MVSPASLSYVVPHLCQLRFFEGRNGTVQCLDFLKGHDTPVGRYSLILLSLFGSSASFTIFSLCYRISILLLRLACWEVIPVRLLGKNNVLLFPPNLTALYLLMKSNRWLPYSNTSSSNQILSYLISIRKQCICHGKSLSKMGTAVIRIYGSK